MNSGVYVVFVFFPIPVTPQVLHKHVPCRTQERSLFLTAVENTWIHGRQKRRERLRQLRELPRALPCPGTSTQTSAAPAPNDGAQDGSSLTAGNGGSSQDPSEHVERNPSEEQKGASENASEEDAGTEPSAPAEAAREAEPKEEPAPEAGEPAKPAQSPDAVAQFLFKCLLNVTCEDGDVVVEMHWVEGQNKDLMNQLCTYLKNTLLKSVAKP